MSKSERRYWGFRIDTNCIEFFQKELKKGNLRQGWGWEKWHDLKQVEVRQEPLPDDESGVYKNEKIRNSVKKGDIILVPRLPSWGLVTIVEATEDWKEGYKFVLPDKPDPCDYGHIFPAKIKMNFGRHDKPVNGEIRTTLQARQRFWNMDRYKDSIEKILDSSGDKNQGFASPVDKVGYCVDEAFDKVREEYQEVTKKFKEEVFDKIHTLFEGAEWENVIVEMLENIYPSSHYQIEHVGGGKREAKHGTDVLIKILGHPVIESEHGIAIQIKDYEGEVNENVIDQINKANYLDSERTKIVKKVVIMTKAKRSENEHLVEKGADIKFIFSEDLKKIVDEYAERYLKKQLSDEVGELFSTSRNLNPK